jgi:serine protease inhibitor
MSNCPLARVSAVLLLILTGVACRDLNSPLAPGAPERVAQLSRSLTGPEVAVRDAANTFSFALWDTVNAAQAGTNVFISPLSASFALGMTMNGADSVTYDQMHAALQFGNASLGDVNGGYHSLVALLQSLDPDVTMQIANSIWYRNTLPVLPSFIDTTRADFGAAVEGLNFADQSASLATINGWVSNATSGKIPTMLDNIDPSTVMFLVNAIYFKGSWRSKFDPALTTSSTFTNSAGTAQPVQLMHKTGGLEYASTSTYQAVDLPYGDSAFTMTVLLPTSGTSVEALSASLTPAAWQSVVSGMRPEESVDLWLPKLTLSYQRQLNADLIALGMVEPFDSLGAHFTRMAAPPDGDRLYIQFVNQRTFLDIDEGGTEAAAATTVGVGIFTAGELPPVMRVDHPYIIVIRERLTGTVLFIGKIVSMP